MLTALTQRRLVGCDALEFEDSTLIWYNTAINNKLIIVFYCVFFNIKKEKSIGGSTFDDRGPGQPSIPLP